MTNYDLNFPNIKFPKFWKSKTLWIFTLVIFGSSFFGFLAGMVSGSVFYFDLKDSLSRFKIASPEKVIEYTPQTTEEGKTIQGFSEVSPAVVSIVITKDLPIFEEFYISPFEEFFGIPQKRQKGTEKKEIGGGTGFIVSEDGI